MLAELENISYYVQAPGHNKRFPGHNSGGINNIISKPAKNWTQYPIVAESILLLVLFIFIEYIIAWS